MMGDPKQHWPQILRDIDDVVRRYGAGISDVGHSPGHVTSGGSTLTPYKFHIRITMPPKPSGEDWKAVPDDFEWTPVKDGAGEKIKGKIEPQNPPSETHIHYHIPAGHKLVQETHAKDGMSVTTVTVRPVK